MIGMDGDKMDVRLTRISLRHKAGQEAKLKLTPEEQQHLHSPRRKKQEAYDYYVHGRYHWARLSPPELLKAADYFRKATQCDPEYALAYSGLADASRPPLPVKRLRKTRFPKRRRPLILPFS